MKCRSSRRLPYRTSPLLAGALLLALAACSADPAETPPPPTTAVAASDSAGAAGTAADAAAGAAAAPPADSATTPAASAPDADAAAPAAGDTTVRLPKVEGRSGRDTMALRRTIRAGRSVTDWPKGPAPRAGAILPGRRIVAYYGNPNSKQMGILGELPPDQMLARLDQEVAAWNRADPSTPVQPALHVVAVVAQGSPGPSNKWRARMDSTGIEKVYGWAKQRDALLFVDIQIGWSSLREELPPLMKFLERPDVHLGIDPEFAMHRTRAGVKPGAKVGTYDAADVNYVIRTLDSLVRARNLPPKVLVVHRFQQSMVTNATSIRPTENVQVVMHMDGHGPAWLKFDSYHHYVVREPVQFTGFKLFYKHDSKSGPLLTPRELVLLHPAPLYIQYQ